MKRLVIFDLDGTLIEGDTSDRLVKFMVKTGVFHKEAMTKMEEFHQLYLRGQLNIDDSTAYLFGLLNGIDRDFLEDLMDEFAQIEHSSMIKRKVPSLLETHREAKDDLIVVTATQEFFVSKLIKNYLKIDNLIATEVHRSEDGKFENRTKGIPSIGAGKITRLQFWLMKRAKILEQLDTIFYSDSINDLPLLKKVKKPIVVDPDEQLKDFAEESGWEIISLK